MSSKKHLIVLSAPSGAGKTTVARHLLKSFAFLRFSVSATTRLIRAGEEHGRDYFFLSRDEFKKAIEHHDLIEYEEIFGNYYGTMKSVVSEAIARGEFLVFDVDVKGALSLRVAFHDDTLLIFIAPPSREVLAERLRSRHTESEEQIDLRLARAEMEMGHQDRFDQILVNEDLQETLTRAEHIVREHTDGAPQQPSLFGDR
ncbi:MAG: guanylate kinase [Candidatus Kapabacteria bacterium]|nr:guanylate kinase [Candidatus Kapabacteria bacterium]